VDCVIKVIVLFVSASGIRENLCFWSKRARILNAQRTVSGSILAAGQEKKKIVVTVELEMVCVLQSMFLMTRRSVVRRWMQDGMLESIVSDV
jgi:hypothetical protein